MPPQDGQSSQDGGPPQTTPILPSLPVKKSVLRQLDITDNEMPHGLVRLKHNLLLSPSDTWSQESNICTNPDSCYAVVWGQEHSELWKRLYAIIAESPIVRRGPDRDEDYYARKMKIFKSMSYLDQIAFVCLASGLRACQAPDCLQYRRKMERVVPVCHSWPGLRDWVLCIISCSLRAEGDMCNSSEPTEDDRTIEDGLTNIYHDNHPDLFRRCWAHLTTCMLLTMSTIPEITRKLGWDSVAMSESETREGTGNESGSIDGPRPGQHIYSVEWMSVSSRCCPRCTPEYF